MQREYRGCFLAVAGPTAVRGGPLGDGFIPRHPSPALQADLRHQCLIGAISVAGGRNFLVTAGQERLKRQFEAQGGRGMLPAERELRLAELGRERRQTMARLELAWRSEEHAARAISRGVLADPECFLALMTPRSPRLPTARRFMS